MSYRIDLCSSVPQYPQNTVYGYVPSIVARQVEKIGAQGFFDMSSRAKPFDNQPDTCLGLGGPTQLAFVWIQVESICFPVLTAAPTSPPPKPTGVEVPAVKTAKDIPQSAPSPVRSEKRTPTTSTPRKSSKMAKPKTTVKGQVPKRNLNQILALGFRFIKHLCTLCTDAM